MTAARVTIRDRQAGSSVSTSASRGAGRSRTGPLSRVAGSRQYGLAPPRRGGAAETVVAHRTGGDEVERLAREFMGHRPRLLGIAYRMLGTTWDAEDIVADAMVRWLAVDRGQVREPGAFLTAMVTRRAVDQLRSARVAREMCTGSGFREPIGAAPSPLDPLDMVERHESLASAVWRILEQLTPPERAVLVLHEALDMSHSAIAEVLHVSQASSRQYLHRARARLGGTRRFDPSPPVHTALLEQLLAALERGDFDDLQDVMASDAVAYAERRGTARAVRSPAPEG